MQNQRRYLEPHSLNVIAIDCDDDDVDDDEIVIIMMSRITVIIAHNKAN